MGSSGLSRGRVRGIFTALWLSVCLWPAAVQAAELINGDSPVGDISPVGDVDEWTFAATVGDSLLVQVGKLSGALLGPRIRLLDPLGVQVETNTGTNSTNVAHVAALNGTYRVLVDDPNADGTGTYRIYLARVPGAFVIPVGDEGGPLTNGDAHAGTIELGDLDIWTFEADAQDTVYAQLAEIGNTSFDPFLLLYDAEGRLVASNFGLTATNLTYQVALGGRHTVIVRDGNADVTGTADYTLHFARVPGAFVVPAGDEGGAFVNGAVQAGTITLADVDLYTFTAEVRETVIVQIGEVGNTSFDPFILLYGPDGNLLTSNFGTTSADLALSVAVTGEYTVVVRDGNADVSGSGDYNLYVGIVGQPFTVPGADQGGVLDNGDVHPGRIDLGDLDLWTFDAQALDTAIIQIGEPGTDNTSFDPFILLYDEAGRLLDSNFGTVSADVGLQLPRAGTYTVVVRDGNGDVTGAGDYNLYLNLVPDAFVVPAGDEGGPLVNGELHPGTIDRADVDLWTVDAEVSDTLFVHIAEVGNTAFDPFILLYAPGGDLVSSNFGTVSADIVFEATVAGTYTVVVKDGNGDVTGVGDYNLYLGVTSQPFVVPAGDEGGVLDNGGVHPGVIDLGDLDQWTIDLEANDLLLVQIGEVGVTAFDPFIILYGPDGTFLTSNFGTVSADLALRAPVAGTYTVIVKDGNGDITGSGAYNLYAARLPADFIVPPGDEGGVLPVGATQNGVLDLGDVDLWSFVANTGDEFTVTLDDTGPGAFDPFVLVYDSAGALVDSDFDTVSAVASGTAPRAGRHTILVKDGNGDVSATGTYALSLALTTNPTPVPPGPLLGPLSNGDRVDSAFTAPGDVDKYSLTVSEGDRVRLKLADLAGTSFMTPLLQVFSSSGALITSATASNVAAVAFEAPAADTLTVAAVNTGTSLGTYDYQLFTAVAPGPFVVPGGDEGGVLANGDRASGLLTTGDLDLYTLAVTAGDEVRLKLGDIAGTSFFTPGLEVFSADGELIGSATGSNVAQVVFRAEETETLSLVLRNTGGSIGSYAYDLYAAIAPGSYVVPPGDDGGALVNGGVASGTLSLGDLDLYSLSVIQGERIRLRLGDPAGTSFFTPAFEVFAADGTRLAASSGSNIAGVVLDAPASETLTIVAFNDTTSTGNYQYDLYTAIAPGAFVVPAGDEGGALRNGGVASGVLTLADFDLYTLEVSAGDRVRLNFGDFAGTSFFTPAIEVFDSAGARIAGSSGSNIVRLSFEAASADTLTVIVRNGVSSTGNYGYDLFTSVAPGPFVQPEGDDGGVLVSGGLAAGTITLADMDLYTLSVDAGDLVRLKLGDIAGTSFFTPDLEVYDGTGTLLAAAASSNIAEVVFRTGSDDELTVVVANAAGNTGNYVFNLYTAIQPEPFVTPAGDEGGELTADNPLAGALSLADMDLFRPAVTAGQEITLSVTDVAGTSFFSPVLQVFREDGSLLGTSSGSNLASLTFRAPATESLTLEVRNSTTSTGTYSYNLLGTGLSTPVDSDGDGLTDLFEDQIGANVNSADTDGDGLTDFEEVNFDGDPAYDPQTDLNPLVADTDGDGADDGIEIDAGTDPLDPTSFPVDIGNLRFGLNFIALPGVAPPGVSTCYDLLAFLGGSGIVESVAAIDRPGQTAPSCRLDNGLAVGDDFPIVAGEGYFARLLEGIMVDFTGVDAACPVSTLEVGVNAVGVPAPLPGETCYSLLDQLGLDAARSIERLNPATRDFEACVSDGADRSGNDFPIRSGEGYLIHLLSGPVVINLNDLGDASRCP